MVQLSHPMSVSDAAYRFSGARGIGANGLRVCEECVLECGTSEDLYSGEVPMLVGAVSMSSPYSKELLFEHPAYSESCDDCT